MTEEDATRFDTDLFIVPLIKKRLSEGAYEKEEGDEYHEAWLAAETRKDEVYFAGLEVGRAGVSRPPRWAIATLWVAAKEEALTRKSRNVERAYAISLMLFYCFVMHDAQGAGLVERFELSINRAARWVRAYDPDEFTDFENHLRDMLLDNSPAPYSLGVSALRKGWRKEGLPTPFDPDADHPWVQRVRDAWQAWQHPGSNSTENSEIANQLLKDALGPIRKIRPNA